MSTPRRLLPLLLVVLALTACGVTVPATARGHGPRRHRLGRNGHAADLGDRRRRRLLTAAYPPPVATTAYADRDGVHLGVGWLGSCMTGTLPPTGPATVTPQADLTCRGG